MPDGDPEIRKGRKYDQVLKGAESVFLSDGFEGASVDDIARAAGVSKATLYSYFPNKSLLFTEVCTLQCRLQAQEALRRIDMSQPPEIVLPQVGRQFLAFILSDHGQRIFRVCLAESERFPEIGQRFFASGPHLLQALLGGYLQQAVERGQLACTDVLRAADQFAELCKAGLWMRVIFGIQARATDAEIAENVDTAVRIFLASHRPPAAVPDT